MALVKKARRGSIKQSPASAARDAVIRSKIDALRQMERHAFRPRHGRTDFYAYLKAVYNAWDWTDPKEARRVYQRVAKLYELAPRANKTAMRAVIDVTSRQNRQDKSRWVKALEYAVAEGIPGTGFRKFLKKNGGMEACARKMAALRKKGAKRKRPPRSDDWD